MVFLFDKGSRPELRKQNSQTIINAGRNLISSYERSTQPVKISQLILKSGNILYNSTLKFKQDNTISTISLKNNELVAQYVLITNKNFQNYHSITNKVLAFSFTIDTFKGFEGSGIGTAMFMLGEYLIKRIIDHEGFRNKYDTMVAYAEDTAHRSGELLEKNGWTSNIMKKNGYSFDRKLLEKLNLYNARKILAKII